MALFILMTQVLLRSRLYSNLQYTYLNREAYGIPRDCLPRQRSLRAHGALRMTKSKNKNLFVEKLAGPGFQSPWASQCCFGSFSIALVSRWT
jgi:hypothetical protein